MCIPPKGPLMPPGGARCIVQKAPSLHAQVGNVSAQLLGVLIFSALQGALNSIEPLFLHVARRRPRGTTPADVIWCRINSTWQQRGERVTRQIWVVSLTSSALDSFSLLSSEGLKTPIQPWSFDHVSWEEKKTGIYSEFEFYSSEMCCSKCVTMCINRLDDCESSDPDDVHRNIRILSTGAVGMNETWGTSWTELQQTLPWSQFEQLLQDFIYNGNVIVEKLNLGSPLCQKVEIKEVISLTQRIPD